MLPTLFKFGSVAVHSYGFMVALAFIVGILLTIHFGKKEKIAADTILDLAIYVIIASVIGARLFYVAGQWDYYRGNLLEMLMVQNGGLVFLGGFLLDLIVVIVFALKKKVPLKKLCDAIAPGAALGYSIGRIGCFLNGCCFGLPTKLPWGITFPAGSLAAVYCPGEALHPTQIYSSLLMLGAFFCLTWFYRRKQFDGQIAAWFFILYSLYRFTVEFFRFSPIHWLSLTPSQWLAIFIFAAGVGGLNYFRK